MNSSKPGAAAVATTLAPKVVMRRRHEGRRRGGRDVLMSHPERATNRHRRGGNSGFPVFFLSLYHVPRPSSPFSKFVMGEQKYCVKS